MGRWLILGAAAAVLAACTPKVTRDPTARTPAQAEEAAGDAGFPMVPLEGKGVIVPSDVKLEPGPKAVSQPAIPAANASVAPTAN